LRLVKVAEAELDLKVEALAMLALKMKVQRGDVKMSHSCLR
jgi:hypothetical protein